MAIVLIGVIASILIGRPILKGIKEISNSTKKISEGDFSVRISENKTKFLGRLSNDFNQMAKELEGVKILRNDFINNFSHEFKTPISSIKNYAEELRNNNLTKEEKDKYLDIINKNNKKCTDSKNNIKKYLKGLGIRTLTIAVIFFSFAIMCKYNNDFKETITKYVFTDVISFTKIKKVYNKYLGGILPIKKEIDTQKVFNEQLNHDNLSVYHDGVSLTIPESYLIPAITEGMVVFIGNKEYYNNTIIIEDLNGVYIWYGNVSTTSLKLYDYVEKGTYIGEAERNLYMVFSKDNKYLNYEEFLK